MIQPGTNARKVNERAKALSLFMTTRFFIDRQMQRLLVVDAKFRPGSGAPFPLCERDLDYSALVSWWEDVKDLPFGVVDLRGREVEVLPNTIEEKTMSKFNSLSQLFAGDFAVDVDYDEVKTRRAVDLFREIRDLGFEYEIDETFEDTWMSNIGYSIDNWNYFGLRCGNTYINDGSWTTNVITVDELAELVANSNATSPAAPVKSVIVLGNDTPLVISGGVVVVNYKNGQKFHLEHEGKATLDVTNRTVTTERSFLKDGQPAYERVVVKLASLESVEADSLKLTVIDENTVTFATTYVL